MTKGYKFLGLLAFVASAAFGLAGCSHEGGGNADAERRLKDYISQSFSVKGVGDRNALLGYLTGEAKNRLAAWSDEQFLQAFLESHRQFIKLVITEVKHPSPTRTDITYELTYLDQSKGADKAGAAAKGDAAKPRDAKVTNKKLCSLELQDGQWYIREVNNIKELIEYRNEMALP